MRLYFCGLLLVSASGYAQDPIQTANQQQMVLQQQAQQQQMVLQQQAQQQQMLNDQIAQQQNMNNMSSILPRPEVHVQPGSQPGEVEVRLKDKGRNTVMYYTTDGWTPTANSTRYTGPLTFSSSVQLRAIAMSGGAHRSPVRVYHVDVPGKPLSLPLNQTAELAAGTRVRLAFLNSVTSHGLQVGDRLPIVLDQDVLDRGKVVAAKSSKVNATVIQVDERGRGGAAGSITFAVHSFGLSDGTAVRLAGIETMEGEGKEGKAVVTELALPLGALLVHGREAVIPKGAVLTATIQPEPAQTASTLR